MKSKLHAARLADQNESSFFGSTASDKWLGSTFGITPASQPAPQSAVGPGPQNAVPPTVSLTTSGVAYTQNFDTLSNTAGSTTNNLTIDGWTFIETGGGARDNEQYAVDTGSSSTGDTYSYGSAGSTERALGQLRSGTLISTIGASFTNNTGSTISSLQITYDGEQWRFGGVHTTADRLNFQISFNATSVDDGAATWTDVDALDFAPPITAGTAGALDGNAAANRIAGITATIGSLNIANGASFWIRWVDVDATGGDDGLAIDNFSITPTTGGGGEAQTVQFNPVSVTQAEGNSGTTVYTFTVTRTGGTTGQLDFSGTIAAGGTDNADYVGGTAPTTFSGSILAGQTSATVTVNIQGDFTIEGDESFTLTITNATNTDGSVTVTIGANDDATGTITNDDANGALAVNDVTIAEGDSGTTAGSFTVTRSGGVTGTVSVDYTITLPGGVGNADGSDVSGPLTGTLTFLDGETSKTIPFSVNGDVTNEPDENFTVTLSNATGGATIGDGTGIGTITNDDAPPAVSIGDASLVEGNDGVSYMVFTVSLSKAAAGTVTVDYATADATALAGSDYVAVAGQVSFAAGEISRTVSVPIVGDSNPENNETLTVTLSNVTGGATIADGSATGTITNDDGALYYSLAGGSFTQDWTNTGQITANDNWSGVPYIIGYLGDIDAGSTTNVDARTLTGANLGAIDVIANLANTTSNSGGVGEFHIADPVVGLQGSGTADAPSIVLYMDATGRSSVRLQANLRDIDNSAPGGNEDNAAQQINVQYRTSATGTWTNVPGGYFADATALGASQVTALDVTLPAGADNAATLEIRIMTTNAAGNDEWVGIDDIVVSSQVGPPSLSIANAAVIEGDAGNTTLAFTVTRSGSSTGAVSAQWFLGLGSGAYAADNNDFIIGMPHIGNVDFADGQTSATINIFVKGDLNPEVDENFTLTLSNPTGGATIADGTATGTIVNDDGTPPLVTINDVTVTEGDAGTSLMTFTVTRTGGTGAFDVDYDTADGSATAGSDYVAASGTLHFGVGQMSDTISVTINGDVDSEFAETFQMVLSGATNFAVTTDATGIGTIASDDPIFIHDIQGTAYFSPILAAEGISTFNTATAGTVIVRAVVTAVDNDGPRQGFYLQEELADWDANPFTSEGIFVFTGATVSGVAVGDIVTVTAHVMEFQGFSSNMPVTTLTSPTSIVVQSSGNPLPSFTLGSMPTAIMTGVTPDYTDSSDGAGDSFDASLYALSFWETVEGMLVTIPDVVVADGFVSTSGGQPIFQAYSASLTDADQINSRGGLTIAGDPPIGPPDTAGTEDDTTNGGRALTDGDLNPDIIEIDFSGFAMDAPAGLANTLSMGDELGDVTGIIEFDFTDRKLFVTDISPGSFVDHTTAQDTTSLGNDDRALTVATFNVENLDPGDGAARFTALAAAIANNLNSPDIICIEEMQDNNGATNDGTTDASTTWQMLVDALNAATGKTYQWVDEAPTNGAEGGEPGGNIRCGFLYDTARVQLGNLDADATLAERRMFTDRIGDGVRDAGDLIAFDDSMLGAEIQTGDWSGTRRSLLGEFTFHGNTIYVTANHFPAKGGSDDFWQFNQNPGSGEPTNGGWTQRNNVAQDVYAMLNHIETNAPGSGIVSGGDYNDFYFYRPLTTVTGYTMADGSARVGGNRFHNLTIELPEAERYTYNFDGRSQAIDHVIVNGMLHGVATYDVVHLNTGFNTSDATPLSDHDPAVAEFNFRTLSETLAGTGGNDLIDVSQGGNDSVDGGDGNDGFFFGGAFTGADQVDGGAGTNDQIGLQGDYSAGITLGANTMVNVEALVVLPGFSYNITSHDGNVAAGQLLSVQATQLAAGQSLTFNGSAETDGAFRFYGGQGNDNLTGGAGDDGFYFGPGGYNGSDILNGGAGTNDQLGLDGDYTLTLGNNLSNIEVVVLLTGPAGNLNDFNISVNDSLLSSGQTMTIFGLQVQTAITFNGMGESDGAFKVYGGSADDTLTGGGGDDWIFGGNGVDEMDGDAGNDVFYFDDVAQSSAAAGDSIYRFALGDKIDVSGIDANSNTVGDDQFNFIGSGAFSGTAGELRAQSFSGIYWTVEADVDGDGNADFALTLFPDDPHPITSADFVL